MCAMTGDVVSNEIVVYSGTSNGVLTLEGCVLTGGPGGIGFPPEPFDAVGSEAPLILINRGK